MPKFQHASSQAFSAREKDRKSPFWGACSPRGTTRMWGPKAPEKSPAGPCIVCHSQQAPPGLRDSDERLVSNSNMRRNSKITRHLRKASNMRLNKIK